MVKTKNSWAKILVLLSTTYVMVGNHLDTVGLASHLSL